MSGQGRYHHVGHRSLLVGDGAFEGLPKGGPDLDAEIGQRWRFRRRHGYHVSILALPHAQRGVTSPPSSPLNRNASSNGQKGYDYPPPGQHVLYPPDHRGLTIGKVRRFMPTDFRGRQKRAMTATNAEAGLQSLTAHRTGSTTVCPASVCNFYRIDGSSSFKGTRFRMPASQPSSAFNSPSFNPVKGL